MLRGINPILGPEILHALRAMGHGDELVIVDANYPAVSNNNRLMRIDGVDAVTVVDAVLSLMPLDSFVDYAALRMEVVGDPKQIPPVCREFAKVVQKHEPGFKIGSLERFAFYERAKTTFATIATGETRFYGNLILKKGVIPPK
ncbi:MAG TPA: RbsD/FucU domain-containing protein [Bauldia sp.]|nr:RbsD/FucU domain-containing protein [Bauldia sp.]